MTDGEPLGQPPAEPERILRVGIDVQANERVTTKADDRAHVVFLDGTALTVGPNSVLVIDKYVYDPNRKTGEMALSATKGVFRFVGGTISKNTEVTITTPSATIGIRGGIATVEVGDTGTTTAHFVYGNSMRVTGQGLTQIATRSGSDITATTTAPPSSPAIRPPGQPSANQSFERAAGRPPAPPLQGLLNQNNVQQKVALQQAVQQQITQPQITPQPVALQTTTPPTTTAIVRPTAVSVDDALERSDFSKKNSRVAPGQMKLAAHFNPQGQGPQGQSGPPSRTAKSAGPTPPPAKPPVLAPQGPRNPKNFLPPPRVGQVSQPVKRSGR